MNRFSIFLVFCLVSLLSACEAVFQADLSTTSDAETRLNIRLTDDPIDLEAVNIDLQMVRVKGENGFEEIDLATHAGIYNLLDFQNGLDTLIATADLSMGRIREVRLILGSRNTVVSGGVTYDLKIPSGSQSGLKIKTCLDLDQLTDFDLLLDFDAAASIHCTGNGKFIMRPVIRVMSAEAQCGEEDEYEDEDDNEFDDLPQAVLDSLANHYAGYDFEVSTEILCDSTDVYTITATRGDTLKFLYFEFEEGELVQSAWPVADEDIPTVIAQAVSDDYPSYELIPGSARQIERASGMIWFSLGLQMQMDSLEVIYDPAGTFICGISIEEEDEEEDNQEDENNEVPEEIGEYLTVNYPGYQFEAHLQVNCAESTFYVVSGKKGPDRIRLYFDLDWILVQTGTPMDENQIPVAVKQAIVADYANFRIMNNKTWEIETANAELSYRVYLKQNNSSLKFYVIYQSDGTFICQEE